MADESPIHSVFSDMAENLTKITFKVFVRESYVPVTHYSFLGENAAPPIRHMEGHMDDLCVAWLSPRFIIDALVNGHYIQFAYLKDQETVRNWIKLYLDQHEGLDLSKHPERIAFNKNAQRAYEMLCGNLKKAEEWQLEKTPKKLSIADIVSML